MKTLLVANDIGLRRAMVGRLLSGISSTRAQRRGVDSSYGPWGREKRGYNSWVVPQVFTPRKQTDCIPGARHWTRLDTKEYIASPVSTLAPVLTSCPVLIVVLVSEVG